MEKYILNEKRINKMKLYKKGKRRKKKNAARGIVLSP
jgi:hypothetical protein